MKLSYDLYYPPGESEVNLPPLVLLHGMMDSRKTWKYIAPKIAASTGRKVYAVDARNHGDSPWSDDITFDILADDLDDFLEQHNLHRAALVGHSMGGRTALTLGLRKPEKVEKLIVEDMNLRNFKVSHTGPILSLLRLMRKTVRNIKPNSDELAVKKSFVESVVTILLNATAQRAKSLFDPEMIPLRKVNGVFSWKANLDAIERMLTTEEKIRQTLSGVYKGDALFLYGTESFFKVDKDTAIPKHFPRAKLVAFPGANHLLHFERPRKFVAEATSFLNAKQNITSKY